MLSLKKMGCGDEDYYLNLTRYYIRRSRKSIPPFDDDEDPGDFFGPGDFGELPELPAEPAGQWMGRGCIALGLSGIVLPEELKPLMQGLHPFTGTQLVQNAFAPNRVPGWDFTSSDPKSVSIVWTQADELLRLKIEAARQRALGRTVRIMEDFLAFSRVGKGGYDHVPVKLVIAAFEHCTSRNQDPQLHTHCLVLNVAVDDAGHTRALFSRPLYVNRDLLGAFYRAALAAELRALGFKLRKHGTSFEIVGVPQELIDAHSTRRQEILAHLQAGGRSGGAAAAVAALDTRKTKTEPPPREELFARWQETNSLHGFTNVNDIIYDPKRIRQGTVAKAIDAAINRLAAQDSHFTRTDFQEAALQEAPALGLDPLEVLRAANNFADGVGNTFTRTTSTLVDLGVHEGQQRLTTKDILDEERELVGHARTLSERAGATVPDQLVEWAIADQTKFVQRRLKKAGKKHATRPKLSDEQRAAVAHLTQDTKGTGSIRILQGLAGTGKTDFVIGVAKRAFEDRGCNVIAITPTAKAGRVLQRDTGMDAQTVTKALGDYELPWGCVLKHHLRQLKRAALGRRTYPLEKPAPIKLTPNDVVILDETGMMATRELRLMLAHIVNSGATLILSGDAKQNPPVGRGAPFLSLANRLGSVQLKHIQRQVDEWARQAATHAAEGEVKEALALLAEHKSVRVGSTVDDAVQQMVDHWRSLGGYADPAKVVALANTNEQTEALNQIFQHDRLRAGILNPNHSIEIHDIDREEGRTYRNRVHVGDQVLFTMNDKRIGVQNGAMGTVAAIRQGIGAIAVRLNDGEIVQVPVKKFPHVRLGYALTKYKAQGDGFPHVVVLVTEAQASLPDFYVCVTRGKQSVTVYTTKSLWDPEKQPIQQSPLVQVLSRQPDLRLATDLLEAKSISLDSATLPPLEIRRIPDDQPDSAPAHSPPGPPHANETTGAADAWNTAELPNVPEDLRPKNAAVTPEREKEATPAATDHSTPPEARRAAAPIGDDEEDVWILPAGPAGRPAKRRKKRRPSDVDTPWDETSTVDDMVQPDAMEVDSTPPDRNASPTDELADAAQEPAPEKDAAPHVSPLVMPEGFLYVPIPNLERWKPDETPTPSDAVVPSEFLTEPVLLPTARRIAGGFRPPLKKDVDPASHRPLPAKLTLEEARRPGVKEKLVRQAREQAIAQACEQFNVPPDRVEPIDVETWEEPTDHGVIFWIRVTYRITTYGRGGLINVADFPVPL